MNLELLKEGCYVMAIGMGTVFLFLTLMIYSMNIMSKFIKWLGKYFPEEIIENKQNKKTIKKDEGAEIALAIATALHLQNTKS